MVEHIVDTAARIFLANGYAETTTNEVAEAAGVSVGSLYQYFPNKDALLVALAERHLDAAAADLDRWAAALRAGRPDIARWCRALVGALEAANEPAELHALLWSAPRSPELAERLAVVEGRLVDEAAWHLERFGCPAERATLRAEVLVAALDAAVHRVVTDDGQARTDELVRLARAMVGDSQP